MAYAAATQTTDRRDANHASQRADRRVGIVLLEGFALPCIGALAEVFQLANGVAARRHIVTGGTRFAYAMHLLSIQGGAVKSSSSVPLHTDAFGDSGRNRFDALFVCGPATAIGGALQQGSFGASMTAGMTARQLAAAWDDAGVFATAVFDMSGALANDRDEPARQALTVVSRDLGAAAAREIADQLAPGAGARLLVASNHGDLSVAERIRRCAQWLRENCARPISVSDAAEEAAMSERNFLRRFKLEMGSTPSEYLLQARLDMTCRLLVSTTLPVEKIARRCGMGSGDNLARMFRKRWAISPTEYRLRHHRSYQTACSSSPRFAPAQVPTQAAITN